MNLINIPAESSSELISSDLLNLVEIKDVENEKSKRSFRKG